MQIHKEPNVKLAHTLEQKFSKKCIEESSAVLVKTRESQAPPPHIFAQKVYDGA